MTMDTSPEIENTHMLRPIKIERMQAFAVSATPSFGPISSLGSMPVRNGVLVALTSSDDVTGWGEIWCNFPPRGNLARLHLLQDVIAPHVIGATYAHYSDCRTDLEQICARMAIHTGEFGPFAHCLAGLDTALADIASRSAGLPLSQFLSPNAASQVPVYASTPNVADLENAVDELIAHGHRGIKLKIGLGPTQDLALLDAFKSISNGRLKVYVDANQNWSVAQAVETMTALGDHQIGFVEEPLRADAAMSEWRALSDALDVPLAAGENITSQTAFLDFMEKGGMTVVQPDVAKWGGVSGAISVGANAIQRGATCAMHYMGSGLGLAASLHTLAAIGGTGPVELDANPNPLRTDLGAIDLTVTNGKLSVPTGHGHGFIPNQGALASMAIATFDLS